MIWAVVTFVYIIGVPITAFLASYFEIINTDELEDVAFFCLLWPVTLPGFGFIYVLAWSTDQGEIAREKKEKKK